MAKTRKQLTFDLDTNALKNFSWLQGSVYVSDKPVTSYNIAKVLKELVEKNNWLNLCMRDCRETDIGREHSKNYLFDKTVKIPTREELETKSSQDASSLKEWKKQINELKNSSNNSVDKIAAKDLHKKER